MLKIEKEMSNVTMKEKQEYLEKACGILVGLIRELTLSYMQPGWISRQTYRVSW
jgi:hypothetical protein